MDCGSEEQLVRLALAGHEGIATLDVDLARRRVVAIHRDNPDGIVDTLRPLGLGAVLLGNVDVTGDQAAAAVVAAAGSHSADHMDAGERRLLWTVLIINAVMFVVETVAGVIAQSAGILADGIDMFADATVYGVALAAVGGTLAAKRRAARLAGWLQLGLAGLVLAEVVRRALVGSEPQSAAMMAVGLLAMVANIVCAALLAAHRADGVHLRATWIFSVNDALANIGVVIAGVLVGVTGSAHPDLAIGLVIAVVVAAGAVRILRISRPAERTSG